MPAVAGLHNASVLVAPGTLVAVDGTTGEVLIEPDAETLEQSKRGSGGGRRYELSLDEYRDLPAVTEDGVEIRLEANIEAPDDAARARARRRRHRAVPVGVPARAAAARRRLTEEAQYRAYRRLVESAAPRRVTIRTFDVSETQLRIEHDGHRAARARRSACAASA